MAAIPDTLSLLIVPGTAIAVLAGVVSTWLLRWLASLDRHNDDGGIWVWVEDTLELFRLGVRADTRDDWWQIGAALAGLGAVGAASAFMWRAVVLGPAAEASDWYAFILFLLFPAAVLVACFGDTGTDRSAPSSDGLLTTYLVALALALFVPVLRTGALSLGQIVATQGEVGPLALSGSGGLALVAAVAATQAALALAPEAGASAAKQQVGATTALVTQLLRSGWLYVCTLSLALNFGSIAGAGGGGAAMLLGGYVFFLLVLAGLSFGIRRSGAERILATGALPTLLLALAAVGLAVGGL